MKKIEKKDWYLLLAQVAVWLVIFLFPSITVLLTTHSWENVRATAITSSYMLRTPIVIYFANFYLFHHLFFSKRYVLFVLANIALVAALNAGVFFLGNVTSGMPMLAKVNMYTGLFVFMLLNVSMVAGPIALRHFIRTNQLRQQLREERAKHTEAELAWLKNQINPHFLFNTLNNISGLTQIDADKAQDALAQLSDLLRYAMYETNKQQVDLGGEIDFMRNYIELMSLRCNNRTTIDYQLDNVDKNVKIAPLLFISLIENAFKHGTSTNRESFIRIRFSQQGDALVFDCENSNFPKNDTDRSGSGIGLENTRRRLELLYHDRYTWNYGVSDDEQTYFSHIELRPQLAVESESSNLKTEAT
ncbi:MAG: histidine kinase [Prevotella sp.]|nr:histidine kinase [Prevotella sp.]